MRPLMVSGLFLALAPVLGGCGSPISNQQIYEDALFLAALPTTDRLGPPDDVRKARVGTSALLEVAVGEASAVEGVSLLLGASGEALRSEPPVERSDTVRRWDPVSTGAVLSATGTSTWLVRGEVVQPAGTDLLDWTIEASADGTEWQVVGAGLHDPAGQGTFTWELAAHGALIDITDPLPQTLEIDYLDATRKADRELLVDDGSLELGGTWQVVGDSVLTWLGPVVLIQGSEPRPGAAQVLHAPGLGGRGQGSLVTVDGEVPFDVCWDANGNDVWVEEDGTPALGYRGNCTVSFD